jgi:hypothetical protein
MKYEKLPIIVVLFHNLGLVQYSKGNPIKKLNYKLEDINSESSISFIFFSNLLLEKKNSINSALVSSIPDIDQNLDNLLEIS